MDIAIIWQSCPGPVQVVHIKYTNLCRDQSMPVVAFQQSYLRPVQPFYDVTVSKAHPQNTCAGIKLYLQASYTIGL